MAADGPGSTWAMRTASSGVTGPSPFITRVTAADVTSRCLANCLALSPRCSSVSARIEPGCGRSCMPLIKISSMFCPTGFSQQQTAPVKAPKKDVSISKGKLPCKPLPSPLSTTEYFEVLFPNVFFTSQCDKLFPHTELLKSLRILTRPRPCFEELNHIPRNSCLRTTSQNAIPLQQ